MMELLRIEELRCYDVLLIAVLMLVVDVVMALWNRQGTAMTPAEVKLMRLYNDQVRVVNRLNSVDTFVEQSKAIRKMNAIKKEMQELAVERMQKAAPSELHKQIDRFRTPALLGLLMVYYWSEPLVVVPTGQMLPIERLLSFPGFPLGAISAVGWASICRRVGAKFIS